MFGKKEAQELKTRFWTNFGVYMRKHKSEYGQKVKWVNYRTGLKDVYFRLKADNKIATVAIELQHPDAGIRELFYEQFLEFKMLLESDLENELIWVRKTYNSNGTEISKIYTQLENKSIYMPNCWGEVFEFFESNLIPIIQFWTDSREVFLDLED